MEFLSCIWHKIFGRREEHKTTIEKIVFSLLCVMIFLVPIIFSFQFKQVFVLPKALLISWAAFVFGCLYVVQIWKSREQSFEVSWFMFLLFLYGVLLTLSSVFSINIYTSVFGIFGKGLGLFMYYCILTITLVTYQIIRTRDDVMRILVVFSVASMLIGVFGLLQHYGFALQNLKLTDEALRAFSTLGHANHFGGYLVQSIFVVWAVALILKKNIEYFLASIFGIILMWALIETSSRGAILAFIVNILILLLFTVWRCWKKIGWKKLCVGILGVLVFLVVVFSIGKKEFAKLDVVSRTKSTIEFLQSGHVPDRLSWLYSAGDMVQDNPVLGTGVETFKDVYNSYRRTDYRVPGDEQDMISPEAAHNEVIHIAATQGLPALLIYLMLLGGLVWRGFKVMRKLPNNDAYALLMLLLALNAYFVQTLLSFGVLGTMLPFFMLIGVTNSYISILGLNEKKVFNLQKNVSVILLLLMVVSLGWHALYMFRASKADRLLRGIEYVQFMDEYKDKGYLPQITLLRKAVDLNSYSFTLFDLLGRLYVKEAALEISKAVKSGDFNAINVAEKYLLDAENAFLSAIKLNKMHPNTYVNLSKSYEGLAKLQLQNNRMSLHENYMEKRFSALELALKLSINNPMYRVIVGDAYADAGDKVRAKALYEEAENIRPEYPRIKEKIANMQ